MWRKWFYCRSLQKSNATVSAFRLLTVWDRGASVCRKVNFSEGSSSIYCSSCIKRDEGNRRYRQPGSDIPQSRFYHTKALRMARWETEWERIITDKMSGNTKNGTDNRFKALQFEDRDGLCVLEGQRPRNRLSFDEIVTLRGQTTPVEPERSEVTEILQSALGHLAT